MMKRVTLAVCVMACAAALAGPKRHPSYEPDGKPVSGKASETANVFLNAKATATGQFEKHVPGLAVNGRRNNSAEHWCAENLPQALTVDMGAAKPISEILFVPYWTDGRIYGFKIEGSVDGKAWKMLADQTANSICAGAAGFTLDFDPVEVRYVRATIVANSRGKKNGAHIVEIEGYARAGGAKGVKSTFLAGDVFARYDRDVMVDAKTLSPVAKLRGWRGERVSAMLVASSQGGFQELRLSAANPAARLDVLRYTLGNGKLYGDILDGTTETSFKGVTRPVVYTFDIPRDASGTIRDVVTAFINGEKRELPVEIAVVPRTLPPVKDWKFHLDLWQHPDAIARWHDVPMGSEEHMRLLLPYNKVLADLGQKTITTTLIDEAWNQQTYDRFRSCVQATKRADGSWAYDYTLFDKIVENMEAAGVKGQIDCYSMLPWSLKFRYFDEKSGRSVAPRMEPGSAEFEDFWGHLLADLCRHTKAKGWFERTKIALDERPDKLIKPALAVLRKYAPGMGLVMACNHPSSLNAEAFDVSYGYRHSEGLVKYAAERRAQGKFTTYYVCCSPARPNTFVFSDPAESAWLAPLSAAMGLDGLLRWAWCSWVENPFDSQDFTAWPSGDTSLVYPGPRLSLRALLLRDGIETFEKVQILGRDNIPELKIFTVKRGGEAGVHAADVRALDAAVNK
ncbi:MAG: DUF4091 domain-containing protein [Kiritimatiellae bacterium]|nr:DUF4091 domain-containing protein [Kiritimatiellia bacterium]